MMRLLAGTRHRVLTAVAVAHEGRVEMRVSESLVTFCPLDEARIDAYVASGALRQGGRYGIQGRAGAFVSRLEGSYTGVMACPCSRRPNCCENSGERSVTGAQTFGTRMKH